MTTHIRLDALGGIAGDMFAAALLDLRPELMPAVRDALALCPLIEDVSVRLADHDDGTLHGRRFVVEKPQSDRPAHNHTRWREIREALERSRLADGIKRHAIGIFTLLAAAEGKVHGCDAADVTFHEVGAWDSIADIVAAATLIDALGADGWSVGPIPLGGGRVETAHGQLPVPAPATAVLLNGFTMLDDGIGGERVTPTGAAIVRHLCADGRAGPAGGRLVGTGHGFGTRRLPGLSNCLRVLALETEAAGSLHHDRVAVLECELDDQTAEDIAQGIDHLRADEDVLDVIQMTAFGKKGRVMVHLQVLARPDGRERVLDLMFRETRTIGIRHALVDRAVLQRRQGSVRVGEADIRFKSAARPDGVTIKAEADDLAAVSGSHHRDGLRARVDEAVRKQGREETE